MSVLPLGTAEALVGALVVFAVLLVLLGVKTVPQGRNDTVERFVRV